MGRREARGRGERRERKRRRKKEGKDGEDVEQQRRCGTADSGS